MVGETHLGSKIDPEGFIKVCKEGPPGASETLAFEIAAVEEELGLFYDPDVMAQLNEGEEEEEEVGEGEGEGGEEAEEEKLDGLISDALDEVLDKMQAAAGSGEGEEEEEEGVDIDEDAEMAPEDIDLLSRVIDQTPMTRDYSSLTPRPQKVYVLMGGDPVRSNESLVLGKEVAGKLAMFKDLQVGWRRN